MRAPKNQDSRRCNGPKKRSPLKNIQDFKCNGPPKRSPLKKYKIKSYIVRVISTNRDLRVCTCLSGTHDRDERTKHCRPPPKCARSHDIYAHSPMRSRATLMVCSQPAPSPDLGCQAQKARPKRNPGVFEHHPCYFYNSGRVPC